MAIIPNIITSLRIFGAISLVFIPKLTLPFYIVYLLCGFTDVLDGFIARSFNCESTLGAKLDSISDLTFYSVTVILFIPMMIEKLHLWVWVFLGVVLGVRCAAYIVAAIKYHRFAAIHTYLNKLTGFMVFLLPLTIEYSIFNGYCVVGCVVGVIASTEELLIHLTQKEYNPAKKYYFKKTENECCCK